MTDYQVNYTDVDGKLTRIFLPVFFGGFAGLGIFFLYHFVVHLPSVSMVVMAGVLVSAVVTWLFSWFTLHLAVHAWRSGTGAWWLRLSNSGFEVNDRILRPRRYKWPDIEKFMLVAPRAQIEHAVLAHAVSFSDAVSHGEGQPPSFHVGYAFSMGHRKPLLRKMNFVGRDGTKSDGVIMGYWDRPFDQAVDLLNEWRRRHPYS